MRENIKISKTDKKRNKKKIFLLKNVVYLVYLLDKCLKMKIHKILEHQMNVYVPTFIKILLFQPYCKQNIRLKKETISILILTQENTVLIEKRIRHLIF